MSLFTAFKTMSITAKLGLTLMFALVIAAVLMAINHFTDRAFESAEETGAANVRVIVAEEGLSNVEDANEAAAQVRSDPVVRNANCLRDSRTPENC